MHLHMHLKQTLLDFGPPHSSWCFAFEHFNGILGSYHTEIELQIMRKFRQNQAIHGLDIQSYTYEKMNSIFPHDFQREVTDVVQSSSLHLLQFAQSSSDGVGSFAFSKNNPHSPFYNDVFGAEIAEQLEAIYKQLYPQRNNFYLLFCIFTKSLAASLLLTILLDLICQGRTVEPHQF